MKHHSRFSFTLLELLLAMGIFVILLGLMLQFFTATQNVWAGVRSKNETYSDARIALDLITSLLQSSVAADRVSAPVLAGSGDNCAIAFIAKTPRRLGSAAALQENRTCAFAFTREADSATSSGKLFLAVEPLRSDNSNLAAADFLSKTSGATFTPAFATTFATTETADRCFEVIRNVSGFTIEAAPSDFGPETAGNRPMFYIITLRVLDSGDAFEQYRALSGASQTAFRAQHEHTFRRIVCFDDIEEPLL